MILHKKLGHIFYPAFTNLVWQLSHKKKVVYLTFDDGPYPPATGPILSLLAQYQASAVFFLSGEMIFKYRHEINRLNYQGHKIGNHGFFHRPYLCLATAKISKEIQTTDRLIVRYLGTSAKLFRPPFGIFGPALNKILNKLNKDLTLWSLMSHDFKWDAWRVTEFLQGNLQSGDIVVFHDSPKAHYTTLSVLPEFLEFCKSRGYQFRLP